MNDHTIKSAILKIELIWSTTLKERSDDLSSYEYITNQSIALRSTAMELKTQIEDRMQQNKRDRLKYQKLCDSLSTIVETLDFRPLPCKDENHIRDILDKLRAIRAQIGILREYQ